jgi:spore photoproduct lyase
MISFSHIYLERAAADLPFSRKLISRLRPTRITEIDDAQRFFKRPGQRFEVQKRAPRLIVAAKRGKKLYAGSERVASFGRERPVFYTDVVRNCLFDCDYCFLQGMHPSANILLNANLDDYADAVDEHLGNEGELYLSISYLSDLLGFERAFGLVRWWVEFARGRGGLDIEVRTKSDGFGAIAELPPHERVLLTWSLTPDRTSREREAGTAAFQQRVLDARRAIRAGWRVRLCFDPIIVTESWRADYQEAIETLFRRVDPSGVEAVSLGVFRMHPDFLERIRAFRDPTAGHLALAQEPRLVSYEDKLRAEVFAFAQRHLLRFMPSERVFVVHG